MVWLRLPLRHLMTRRGAPLLAWLALGLPALAQTPVQPRPLAERPVLQVGTTVDSYPHGYRDKDGQLKGFTYDLLDAVAKATRLRIERVAAPGREVQARFRAGEFDLLQALSQSPDREAYADFSVPFLALQGALFTQRAGNPIRRIEDLNGRRFAIIGAGSIVEKFLRDHALQVEPVLVSSSEEALRKVEEGDCAAAFLSQLTALSVIERHGLRNVAMFGDPLNGYDVRHSYAVHRGDAELLARLNEGLALVHRNGDYDRIYGRWFGRFDSPLITREQVVTYGALALGLGLLAALAAYLRQRSLVRRIAGQAEELARQKALFQALHDHVPLGLAVIECELGRHRVLTLNQQAATFLSSDPTGSGRWLDELPLSTAWRALLHEILTGSPAPSGQSAEEHLLPGSGRRFVFTRVILPAGPDGAARICLLFEEVTARRTLEEEIAQSRKLRAVGELVGGIAHEFNNLLTPILLKADALHHDFVGQRHLQSEINLILQAAQRAAELTRRLLTFGRKTEVRIEPVHLGAAVETTFALLRLTVDRRIAWHNAVSPGLPPLLINPTELNQILVNLILNARDTLLDKLARGGGDWTPRIEVEAVALSADELAAHAVPAPPHPVLGWQRLTVRDNGLGMTPDVRERIFEPFYTTKAVGKGTGLGLATVWHLVHFAGGFIEVESTPGTGTAFHVHLPVTTASPTVPATPDVPAPAPTGPVRIFLADDDDAVGGAIVAALRHVGHEVHREHDGLAAWQHLSAHPHAYRLVMLDINMPGLSGIELLERLRHQRIYTGPVLIVSGRLGSEEMQKLTAAQVTSVLHKPFRLAELLAAVRSCLEKSPAHSPESPR